MSLLAPGIPERYRPQARAAFGAESRSSGLSKSTTTTLLVVSAVLNGVSALLSPSDSPQRPLLTVAAGSFAVAAIASVVEP